MFKQFPSSKKVEGKTRDHRSGNSQNRTTTPAPPPPNAHAGPRNPLKMPPPKNIQRGNTPPQRCHPPVTQTRHASELQRGELRIATGAHPAPKRRFNAMVTILPDNAFITILAADCHAPQHPPVGAMHLSGPLNARKSSPGDTPQSLRRHPTVCFARS